MAKGNYPDAPYKPAGISGRDKPKGKWWQQKKGEVNKAIFPLVGALRNRNQNHYVKLHRFHRLYEHGDASVYHESVKSKNIRGFMTKKLAFNVGKSCVDTASAKIARNKPRPVYMGGRESWENAQRAKAMTKFMEGMFQTVGHGQGDERSVYGIGRRVFVDSAVTGTGAIHVYPDFESGKVCAEKISMKELVVDEFEAMYGPPKSLHRHLILPKEVVKGMFNHVPNIEKKVDKANPAEVSEDERTENTEYIDIIESWHLKSGEDANDGVHTICIDGTDLVYEEYTKEHFPILPMRWTPRLSGFFGLGLIEELYGIQFEINKLLYNIQLAQHLVAVPQVWLDVMSASIPQHLNNQIGAARYYKGRPPIFMTPGAMSGEIYNHLENLFKKAYEITGVSMLAATSRKPSGLDSGVALREYKDTQTERFALIEQRYEEWFMDIAALIEDACEDLHDAGKKVTAEVQTGKYLERLDWAKIRLPKDRRIVRPHPSNILPSEPAGRLQTVQELVQAGFFEKEEALDLLDYPDLGKIRRLKTSGINSVMKVLEEMLDTGKYITPEPFMDLERARPLAQSYYLEAKLNSAPEDRLELLRRFMEDVSGLLSGQTDEAAAMQQQAMMEQQQAQAMQQAAAEPQPTSDLVPQVQ